MGGKNLRVTSTHNTSSVSVLPQNISLNNGEQTTTMQTANSPNTESVKTNIKVKTINAFITSMLI